MSKGFQRLLTEKRTFYALLVVVMAAALLLLTADIFSQSRDGRRQIVDLDGGEELPVDSQLATEEELRLEKMLANIAGVGENRVMITWQEEAEAVSVFSSQEKRRKIQGVMIAAQGAGNPAVKLSIMEAVASVYGISTSDVMVFQLVQ